MKRILYRVPSAVVVIPLLIFSLTAFGIGLYSFLQLGLNYVDRDLPQSPRAQVSQEVRTAVETSPPEPTISELKEMIEVSWSDWPIGETENSSALINTYIDDGKYCLEILGKKYTNHHIWSGIQTGQEFEVEVDVQKESGLTSDAYGLAFGKDFANRYVFLITDLPEYWVSVMQAGAWYTVIPSTRTEVIKPRGVNRLRVVSSGDLIQFFINGEYVGEANAYVFSHSNVGISVEVRDRHEATILFDHFSYTTP